MNRRLFWLGLGLIPTVALTALWWSRPNGPPRADTVAAVAAPGPAGGTVAEVAALRREVAALRKLTGAVVGHQAAAATKTPAGDGAGKAVARAPRPAPGERRQMVSDLLEDRFSREAADPGWSGARVQSIRQAFASSVAGVRVMGAECGSTICRVQLEHSDPASQDSLMERTAEVDDLSVESFFLFDRKATPPRTTLYLGRAGHPLPRPRS